MFQRASDDNFFPKNIPARQHNKSIAPPIFRVKFKHRTKPRAVLSPYVLVRAFHNQKRLRYGNGGDDYIADSHFVTQQSRY